MQTLKSQSTRMLPDFKSKIKLFLLVALIAVVISVGGILLLKTLQSSLPPAQPTGQQTSPPVQSPEPQMLDTSDWQTYHNDSHGFEIKYPLFLQRIERGSYEELSYCDGQARSVDAREYCVGTQYTIRIMVYDESYNPEQVKKYYDAAPLLADGRSGIREYEINGKKFSIGKQAVYEYEGWATHTALCSKTVGISFSGNAYVFQPNSNDLTSKELQNIEQILSTFRFVE